MSKKLNFATTFQNKCHVFACWISIRYNSKLKIGWLTQEGKCTYFHIFYKKKKKLHVQYSENDKSTRTMSTHTNVYIWKPKLREIKLWNAGRDSCVETDQVPVTTPEHTQSMKLAATNNRKGGTLKWLLKKNKRTNQKKTWWRSSPLQTDEHVQTFIFSSLYTRQTIYLLSLDLERLQKKKERKTLTLQFSCEKQLKDDALQISHVSVLHTIKHN